MVRPITFITRCEASLRSPARLRVGLGLGGSSRGFLGGLRVRRIGLSELVQRGR